MGGALFVLQQMWTTSTKLPALSATHWGQLWVSIALLAGLLCSAGATVRAESTTATAATPASQIDFYPNAGQSSAQQERDRYECFLAAARQARFDPSVPQLPATYRFAIVASPTPLPKAAGPADDTPPATTTGGDLGQRAVHYRQLVRDCLVQRGYAVH